MLKTSPSDLDTFRAYRREEEFTLEAFMSQLRRQNVATKEMLRGRAFAKAMENMEMGDSSTIHADGHLFAFSCDVELPHTTRREEWGSKDYDDVTVRARCDRHIGNCIVDDKTTGQFDAEKYQDKFQWRYYLDIFEADRFDWHIWEVKEMDSPEPGVTAWCVHAHHLLTQYRYAELEADCRDLALDFRDFATRIGWQGKAA